MDALKPKAGSLSLGRIEPYLVAIALSTAAFWILLPLPIYLLHGDLHDVIWDYNAEALALTYFDTGFARRELTGTLARFISPDPMIAAPILHILTTFALAAALILLVTRSHSTMPRRVILGLGALVILWRLMSFIGGVDALIMLLGLAAAFAVTRERWIAASLLISVALLVHETGVIVLVPLLAIICVERGTWRDLKSRRGAVAMAILAIALLLYLVSLGSPPDHVGEIARRIHAEIASHIGEDQAATADSALYYTLMGTRGVRTAQCVMWSDPNYPIGFTSAILLTVLFGLGLRSWKRWPSLVPILAWVICLSLIGTDLGRWTTFALFSVLTVALLEDQPLPIDINMPRGFMALAAFLAMSAGLNTHGNYLPIPLADLFRHSSDFTSFQGKTMKDCDPDWRASIGLL